MKLADYARMLGISYQTAHRLYKNNKLPVAVQQLPSGTLIVHLEQEIQPKVVLYGRVSSHDQKEDLARQMERLRSFAMGKGYVISEEITDIGSGLNPTRKHIINLLKRKDITHIVVEHKDRLTRFGFELLEAALSASNRQIIIANESDLKSDLVQDFIDVITSMCARIYGKRSAKNKAQKALKAISE